VTDLARVTVVWNEGEAEIVCGLLRTAGIECFYRRTDLSSATVRSPVPSTSWEIVVSASELGAARELLAAKPESSE